MSLIREIDKENSSEKEESLETRICKNYQRSRLYGLDQNTFSIIHSLFFVALDIVTTLTGFMPYIYDVSKSLCVFFEDSI